MFDGHLNPLVTLNMPWQRGENMHNVYGSQFHVRIIFSGIMIFVNL